MALPLKIGNDPDWLHPSLVPPIQDAEMPSLEAKASDWMNVDKNDSTKLIEALANVETQPIESREAIATIIQILWARMRVVVNQEGIRRDREYARIIEDELRRVKGNDNLATLWGINAKRNHETSVPGKVEHVAREIIVKDFEMLKTFLESVRNDEKKD